MATPPNPFALGLKGLRRPTPKRIYRFRRRVKRLRAYLALYAFPAPPPTCSALDALFKAAGKLRQLHLIHDQVQQICADLQKKSKKELRKKEEKFIQSYKGNRKEAARCVKNWKQKFPPPWTNGGREKAWERQGKRWLQAKRTQLVSFPETPDTPHVWHDLRRFLRQWELAGKWVPLSPLPPAELTQALGETRDLHLLLRWLQKQGAPPKCQSPVIEAFRRKEEEALRQWQEWRSSWV
ncbi:MAG: CHAD domain-containing protein [Bacteroidia bacterium]|nr:CHAD domain-containing protein [Bacteroidia bacterium]